MTSAGTGAVFFLGTRAHYQVLQTPDNRSYDVENGNASTETIYQNTATQEVWNDGQTNNQVDNSLNCEVNEVLANDNCNTEMGSSVKRRSKRCASEITLCEVDNDMKPALLNHLDSETPKTKPRARVSLIAFLARLAKRAKTPNEAQSYALQSALTVCSYREACRCLDCQSRYFECDESEGYSSDDSEYSRYLQDYQAQTQEPQREMEDDEDDEVFIDTVPDDNTSTDLLIEAEPPPRFAEKMSISSDDVDDASLQLEVAAGTPALLNYLLNHPITCSIQ